MSAKSAACLVLREKRSNAVIIAGNPRIDGRRHGPMVYCSSTYTVLLFTVVKSTRKEAQIIRQLQWAEERQLFYTTTSPYCVGETGLMVLKRREIGHGKLAKRGYPRIMPSLMNSPYTVRVVSEITERFFFYWLRTVHL